MPQGTILTDEELKVLKFWFLSCEDRSIDKWREFCRSCPLKEKCSSLRRKLGIGSE
jgi:hypothetical protein